MISNSNLFRYINIIIGFIFILFVIPSTVFAADPECAYCMSSEPLGHPSMIAKRHFPEASVV